VNKKSLKQVDPKINLYQFYREGQNNKKLRRYMKTKKYFSLENNLAFWSYQIKIVVNFLTKSKQF